eukprot:Lithocolla_globosa_v1_NODE_2117_length_2158_cov_5.185925.p2 type:complete len:120 gc:universal NODE_2117_length_2158_cov_5.185925:1806-1447(-)
MKTSSSHPNQRKRILFRLKNLLKIQNGLRLFVLSVNTGLEFIESSKPQPATLTIYCHLQNTRMPVLSLTMKGDVGNLVFLQDLRGSCLNTCRSNQCLSPSVNLHSKESTPVENLNRSAY